MKPTDRLAQAGDDIAYVQAHWHAFALALRDRTPDGYSSGGDGQPGGGISNPTLAAVGARERWTEKWQEAEALTIELQAGARRLAKLMTTVGGQQVIADQCNGIGLPGFHEWGDPVCRDAPVRGPICYRCYMRSYRWTRGQTA